MTAAYLVTTAVLLLSVLAVRHHRPSVSVPVVIMVLAAAGWTFVRALRGPDDPEPSVVVAVNVVFVQICVVAFYVITRRLVHGRWNPSAWVWVAAVAFATASFVGMLPQVAITDGDLYYASPVYVVHLGYTFAFLGGGVLTISTRRNDPSPHVRRVVRAVEVAAVLVVTFQVLLPALTPLAVSAVAVVMVWTTGHVGAWSRSASRADRLLDSIGVFIFVVDRAGRLQDWNGPAASLLRLTGGTADQGLDLSAALSMQPAFIDGSTVTLPIQGGELRTSLTVHTVDPLSRASDLVLMFRPVRSSVESSSFPTVSGALKGHDPATQTLGRKAALEQLRAAAEVGRRMLRLDIVPRTPQRADEVMFLMARRMEARAAESGWPDVEWARLDTWTFVTPIIDPNFEGIPAHVEIEDMGLDMEISFFDPIPGESANDFVRRVSVDEYDRNSVQNI